MFLFQCVLWFNTLEVNIRQSVFSDLLVNVPIDTFHFGRECRPENSGCGSHGVDVTVLRLRTGCPLFLHMCFYPVHFFSF